jgi:hypothetical protein
MRSIRLSTAIAGAAFAIVLSAGGTLAASPTPPEQQTGSIEPPVIRDSSASTGARCIFANTGPLRLQKIEVVAPEVQWPDDNSDNDNQHGTVGHRIIVQKSTDGGTTWTKYKASSLQKKTAYEHTAAPLTKRTVLITATGSNKMFRVLSKIVWFNKDGTTRGTLKHWYDYSRWQSDQFAWNISQGPCPQIVLN